MNYYIAVSYQLFIKFRGEEEERLQEQRTEEQPFVFITGIGKVLPPFEKQVEGLKKGDDIDFHVQPAEAFGEYDEKLVLDKVAGHIEMSHVTFRYDDNMPYVLNDLSLNIQPGEYVAIVGRTGCGKSTLVRLLLGFEKPEKGAIYYDRHALNNVDPRSLRKHIGVVIQNGQLFQGDIFSNITISAPQLTLEEAWEAAETAGIAQDIREMPMGMQTLISEGQGGISGGQKQRLMIARAIAPKPKILIFDEATSALDNKTQRQVSDALDRLNCTRIVIAHGWTHPVSSRREIPNKSGAHHTII